MHMYMYNFAIEIKLQYKLIKGKFSNYRDKIFTGKKLNMKLKAPQVKNGRGTIRH